MTLRALLFMGIAWAAVLGLTFWCYYKLMRADASSEKMPPPGTSL